MLVRSDLSIGLALDGTGNVDGGPEVHNAQYVSDAGDDRSYRDDFPCAPTDHIADKADGRADECRREVHRSHQGCSRKWTQYSRYIRIP